MFPHTKTTSVQSINSCAAWPLTEQQHILTYAHWLIQGGGFQSPNTNSGTSYERVVSELLLPSESTESNPESNIMIRKHEHTFFSLLFSSSKLVQWLENCYMD